MAVEQDHPRRAGRYIPFSRRHAFRVYCHRGHRGHRGRATAVGWALPTVFLLRATSDEGRATVPSADSERATAHESRTTAWEPLMNADQSEVRRHGWGGDARFVRWLGGTASAPATRFTQPKRAASAKGGQPNPADKGCSLVGCAVHTILEKARPRSAMGLPEADGGSLPHWGLQHGTPSDGQPRSEQAPFRQGGTQRYSELCTGSRELPSPVNLCLKD